MKEKFFIFFLSIFLICPLNVSYALITLSEEEKIGKQILQEISTKVEFVQDMELIAILNMVGNRLVNKGLEFSPFQFKFFLIKDDTFNAFSIPGGYIFINSGIFENIDSEEELAAIIAHEMAHNICRHIARRIEDIKKMQVAITATTLAAILLGKGKFAETVGIASSALAETRLLAYSRADEEEADRIGFQILTKAGYNPWGMVKVMEKLFHQSNLAIELNYRYLLTHPLPQERLDYLINLAQKYETKEILLKNLDQYYFQRISIKAKIISKDPADLVLKYREELNKENNPWIRYSLALALAEERFFKEAINEMELALKELPFKPYFLVDLAEIYFNSGNYYQTLAILENIKIFTNSENIWERFYISKLEYIRARTLLEVSQIYEAYKIFVGLEKNVMLQNDPYFYFHFGKTCSKLNKEAEAHFYFGKYYELKGDYKTAYFHYKKALSFLSKTDTMYNKVKESLERVEMN